MSAYIYILTDGANTKIGTTISLDKRLSAYNTHNPNFYNYKTYECPTIEEARKIESVIKLYFKEQLTGAGKEWFAVSPEAINKVVVGLLEPLVEEIITPAMHGVRMSNEAYETLDAITKSLKKGNGYNTDDSYAQKNKMAELFASTFKLGIPEHRLPPDLVHKDGFNVDLYNCDSQVEEVRNAVTSNHIKLPFNDHTARFYHLIKLSSGSYIAICTSSVAMPYLPTFEGKESEIYEKARELGMYAFLYNEWSWHAPEETGLILFTHKTPIPKRINLWQASFRKWVIERSKLLEQQATDANIEHDILSKTIHDICFDYTFPLHIKSAQELYDEYLDPYFYLTWDANPPHFMMQAYKYLFEKWQQTKG